VSEEIKSRLYPGSWTPGVLRRLTFRVENDDYLKLKHLAARDDRTPEREAAWLIRQELDKGIRALEARERAAARGRRKDGDGVTKRHRIGGKTAGRRTRRTA
jgi:predicted transcriptional regulator